MINIESAWQFGAALGLGMLIGLERERTRDQRQSFAGVRTFALVALLGATAVFTGIHSGLAWFPAVVFASIAGLIVAAYIMTARAGDLGMTTEVSVLLTFFIGGGLGGLGGGLEVLNNHNRKTAIF